MTGYDERQFVGWGIVGLSVGAILLCLAAAALVDGEMEFWLSFGGGICVDAPDAEHVACSG